MRRLFLIFLFSLALKTQAQEVEVLIFGTFHRFQEEYLESQNFKQIQDNLFSFKPDIICIESIPIDDSLSMMEIWPKSGKYADTLKAQLASGQYDSVATPLQLKAAELWSDYDFWNAYYYWDSLAVGQSPGSFSPYHRNLVFSEYGNIVFPLARKLGVPSFYNIDYRYNEKTFLQSQNKAFKQLIFRLKWKPVKTYLRLQKKTKKYEAQGKLIPFVNSTEFQNDFKQLIDELPSRLKKSKEARFVKTYWHHRNKMMAQRIQAAAKGSGAKKVLVTVGSAHVGHIKLYLEKSGYLVTTYDQWVSETLDQ
ncbi:MAG: DUF5694 domain-containing protein [Bacteroidota bacterium]